LIVSFVGSSGVGKTTLIERLIPLLRAAGLRTGTMKHASHGHDVDKVGSDSWRHRRAGAEAVLLAGVDGAVLFLAADAEQAGDDSVVVDRLAELVPVHLAGLDVVLAEGFAPLSDLFVEVRRRGVPAKEVSSPRQAWLTITDEPSTTEGHYGFDDLEAVARRIVDHAGRIEEQQDSDRPE